MTLATSPAALSIFTKPIDLLSRRMPTQTFTERLEIDRAADQPSDIWGAVNCVKWKVDEMVKMVPALLPELVYEPFIDVDAFMQRVGIKFGKDDEMEREYTRSILFAAIGNPHVKMYQYDHEHLLLWNQLVNRWEILGKTEFSLSKHTHTTTFQEIDFSMLFLSVWKRHQPAWEAARKVLCDKIAEQDVRWTYPVDPNFNVNLGRLFGSHGSGNESLVAYVVVLCDIDADLVPATRIKRAKLLAFPGNFFKTLNPFRPLTKTEFRHRQFHYTYVPSADPTAGDVIRGAYLHMMRGGTTFVENIAGDYYTEIDIHGETRDKKNPHTPCQRVLFLLERDVNMDMVRHLGTPVEISPA